MYEKRFFGDVVLVAQQFSHVQRRRVEEVLARFLQQERLGVNSGRLTFHFLLQDRFLRRFQNAIQPPQNGKRKNDATVFGLLVIAAQQVRDRPNERGEVLFAHEP